MAYGNGLTLGLPNFFNTGDGVASDISRAYLFRISIPVIEAAAPDYGTQSLLTAWCQSTRLPSFKLTQQDIKFQSQTIRIANVSEFDGTWDAEFLLDEKHTLRAAMLAWMQAIYDPNKMLHAAPNTYKTDDIKIEQLSKNGSPVCIYTLVGAYPSEIAEIELGHDKLEPSKFKTTFRYDYFTISFNGTGQQVGGEQSNIA